MDARRKKKAWVLAWIVAMYVGIALAAGSMGHDHGAAAGWEIGYGAAVMRLGEEVGEEAALAAFFGEQWGELSREGVTMADVEAHVNGLADDAYVREEVAAWTGMALLGVGAWIAWRRIPRLFPSRRDGGGDKKAGQLS